MDSLRLEVELREQGQVLATRTEAGWEEASLGAGLRSGSSARRGIDAAGGEFESLREGAGVSVAGADDPALVAAADIGVAILAGLPPWVAAIVAVIPGQLAAPRLGDLAGVELDRAHGLREVTLTQ